eukprot:Nitzschia sp. Nitz4//scaffold47_size129522//111469//112419//NITZ4_003567-RA/size129522-snap-gene-0.189-mRNA-1//1//CDS//3329552848//7475//frame0
MRVRSRKKKSVKYRFLPVFILLGPPLFIFFAAMALHPPTLPTATITLKSNPVISYVRSKDDTSVYRYTAYYVTDESTTKTPMSVVQWASLLAADGTEQEVALARSMAHNLTQVIQAVPYKGFRLETKSCQSSNVQDQLFEFVLVDDPSLATFAAKADASFFQEHFDKAQGNTRGKKLPAATTFSNLGGDARLISPLPWHTDENEAPISGTYGHLANFVRSASPRQQQDTWRLVAQAYLARIQDRPTAPVWLSTAGDGVPWLHFRLDDRPKYYHYEPFRTSTSEG